VLGEIAKTQTVLAQALSRPRNVVRDGGGKITGVD